MTYIITLLLGGIWIELLTIHNDLGEMEWLLRRIERNTDEVN